MSDQPCHGLLRRITGAWAIPHALARISAWADTNRQAITEATRPPTIGERLYPIPDRCPQMHSRIYPGPIAAQIASITKSRVPQAGQPDDEGNHP